MGSMDSAFGASFEERFEPDDFYESFLAPKFHDFTAPEEPVDSDSYFMAKPGILKKAFATGEGVKPAVPTIQKEAPKTVAAQAPPKSPVAAERTAASTGSAKKATRVIATSVTSLAIKPLKKDAREAMQEKHNNTANTANGSSLKSTSLAKKLQASENDDPNSPTKNSSSDVATSKLAKQRSIKAQEESALTRQRSQKVLETKPVEHNTSVESSISKENDAKKTLQAKTPVKEAAEAAGSGHHCKSLRCAANDPNFASPVPTKKYLVAKKGTVGSLRKATTLENEVAADGVKAKLALDEVFQKMALDPEEVLSASEVEGLQEVPLAEEKASISADEIRESIRLSVTLEKKAASETTTETCPEEQKEIETFLKVASECSENIDLETLEVPPISKQGKKRKSGEFVPAGASKRANCISDKTRYKAISKKMSQVREPVASKIPNKLRMRRVSVAKRLSIARTGSRVTNPRPFRLRTQERGAMKEKEFIKKVEEYKAAKEGFHSAFQGLAVAEPKIPAKSLKPGHVFSAIRADPKPQDEREGETRAMKAGLPPAHRAPLFGHPFKPHRSTKKLTVPQEPKFHTARGSRNCPSHAVAV